MSERKADKDKDFGHFYSALQSDISARQSKIDSLQNVIREHNSYSDESVSIAPEVKVLFPNIKDIAISRMVAVSTKADSGKLPTP